MKKQHLIKSFVLILVLFILVPCYAINYPSKANTKNNKTELSTGYSFALKENNYQPSFLETDDEYRLGIMNIQIDALGVLFFGPQVSLDFQFANFIAIGPDVTWHYAGLLYQMFMTEFFSDGTTLGLKTFGYGGHMKFLIPAGSGQHRPYIGFGYEKFIGEETYDDYDLGLKYAEYKSNVLHVDLGYRLITDGSFNLSVGLSLAVSKVAETLYYYESNVDEIFYNEPGETQVFPILQMALGWQIGK